MKSIKQPLNESPQKIKKLTQAQRKFILNLINRAKDPKEFSPEAFGDFNKSASENRTDKDLNAVQGLEKKLTKELEDKGSKIPEDLKNIDKQNFENLVKTLDKNLQILANKNLGDKMNTVIKELHNSLKPHIIKAEAEKIKNTVFEESTQPEKKSNFLVRFVKGIGNLLHLRVSSRQVKDALLSDEQNR